MQQYKWHPTKWTLVQIPAGAVLLNGNMIGKISEWWENSGHENRKINKKNSGTVENFPQVETKPLPVHGNFSTAAFVI
jgi:hypothetical protein